MKKWVCLLLSLLLGLGAVSVAVAEGYGEISYMAWGDDTERMLYQTVLDEFVAQNPGTTVNYLFTPDDYYTKLQTMIAGNAVPDVFWIAETRAAEFAPFGVLEPLDAYIEKSPAVLEDYIESLLEYGKYEDVLYAIPKDWASIVVYMNTDLFGAAGVEVPTGAWTVADMRETARKLTVAEGGRTQQYGLALSVYRADWMSLGASFGAEWFKDGKSNFSDPKMVEMMQYFYDLINVDGATPSPVSLSSMGTDQSTLFETGKVAMLVTGRWSTPYYRTACNFNWNVVEVPTGPDGARGIPVISGMLAIGKEAKNKEGGWALIEYLLSHEALKSVLSGGLSMPAFTSMLADESIVTTPPDAQPFINSADYVGIPSQVAVLKTGKYAKYQDIIHAEMEMCFNNEQTPEEACANIDARANAELFK